MTDRHDTGGAIGSGYDYELEIRLGESDTLIARYFLYGVPQPILPAHITKWTKHMTDTVYIVLKRLKTEIPDVDESVASADPVPMLPGGVQELDS